MQEPSEERANTAPSKSGEMLHRREERLHEIRRHAEEEYSVPGVDAYSLGTSYLRASAENGYYGLPALKAPPWTAEVPVYLFAGGAAGASAVIGCAASLLAPSDRQLISDARWLAAIGGALSPALLTSDLGLPSRFLNMLRVFKIRSPMSVGSWTLVAFSSTSAAAAFATSFHKRGGTLRFVENAAAVLSGIFGLGLATYTGVLIGATAIPAWYENVQVLPVHFAVSGLAAAVSILELKGHASNRALNALGIGAAAAETIIGASIEANRKPAVAPLKSGKSGWITRLGGILSGPLPLVLRIIAGSSGTRQSIRLRRMAAASMIAGSLLTRQGWIQAGCASAENPSVPLELPARPSLSE